MFCYSEFEHSIKYLKQYHPEHMQRKIDLMIPSGVAQVTWPPCSIRDFTVSSLPAEMAMNNSSGSTATAIGAIIVATTTNT